MKLYFQNANEEIELPNDFRPKFPSFKRRTNFKARYGQDGTINVADGRIDGGKIGFAYLNTSNDLEDIAIDGNPSGENSEQTKDNAYKIFIRLLLGFFNPEFGPFYLIDRDANLGEGLRTEIVYISHRDEPDAGNLYRIGKNSLDVEMLSGVWEDENEQIVSDTDGLINGSILTVPNDGELPCYFKIEIDAFSQVETIKITNQENDQVLEYSNISFGSGNKLIMDGSGEEGIVTLDGVDNSFALVDGTGFIVLEPSDNELLFGMTSGSVSVVITYRRKYSI